jgi:hypothetical protein
MFIHAFTDNPPDMSIALSDQSFEVPRQINESSIEDKTPHLYDSEIGPDHRKVEKNWWTAMVTRML